MRKTLADMNVAEARRILSQCGPVAMYDYMADFGDKYAVLANGVARGGSLSGNAALRHMQSIAEKSGKTLSEQNVDKIRLDMAEAYLNVRTEKHRDGRYTQLTAEEAQAFHRRVFRDNDLPEKAWTLEVPFNMWGAKGREALWQDILDSAGTHGGELGVSMGVFGTMGGIQYGLSQVVAHNPFGGIVSPDSYKRDVENLHDVSEWLVTNVSVDNLKEGIFGPGQPEAAQEILECIADPQVNDVDTSIPALL